uniref:Uncharacterized protein n=1 Tax=Arundo donax TaxID=35708 RepID=A0A0A8ZZK9_ARUDO
MEYPSVSIEMLAIF